MKRGVGIRLGILIYICSLASIAVASDNRGISINDVKSIFLAKSGLANDDAALEKFERVVEQLAKRQHQYNDEAEFIEYLYYHTHQKLLKQYQQYSSIAETLVNGDYDCLTATTVYSLILTELSINYALVETNYHIYILVNPDTDNEILIETTDPRNGVMSNAREIQEAKTKYRTENLTNRDTQITFEFNIERRLVGNELLGLLYYNQSIRELNNSQWVKARNLIYEALRYYPNERVTTLISILEGNQKSASL